MLPRRTARGRRQDGGAACGLGCSGAGRPGFLGPSRVPRFKDERSAEHEGAASLVHGAPEQSGRGTRDGDARTPPAHSRGPYSTWPGGSPRAPARRVRWRQGAAEPFPWLLGPRSGAGPDFPCSPSPSMEAVLLRKPERWSGGAVRGLQAVFQGQRGRRAGGNDPPPQAGAACSAAKP